MYEWQLRNAVSSNLDAMKAVDAGSSKTFTWGTGWFGYKATDAFTDVYQALRNFSIAQKGDIWVGPVEDGDRVVQIRYRSFITDRYDFDFPYMDEIAIAIAGLANPFDVHGQTGLIVYETTLSSLDPKTISFDF